MTPFSKVESGDAVRIRRAAHYLANSAAAVNDPELLRACRDLELAAEPDRAICGTCRRHSASRR